MGRFVGGYFRQRAGARRGAPDGLFKGRDDPAFLQAGESRCRKVSNSA